MLATQLRLAHASKEFNTQPASGRRTGRTETHHAERYQKECCGNEVRPYGTHKPFSKFFDEFEATKDLTGAEHSAECHGSGLVAPMTIVWIKVFFDS